MSKLDEMKDVVGYEGLYAVTSCGHIWSYPKDGSGGHRGKWVSQCNSNGYLIVGLRKDKKKKMHSVHRIVAETFLENPKNLPQVNHKDSNKCNNNIANLEWCNASENILHHYAKFGFNKTDKFLESVRENAKIARTYIGKKGKTLCQN